MRLYLSLYPSHIVSWDDCAEQIIAPGATTSGLLIVLIFPLTSVHSTGPLELKLAIDK